MYFQKFDLKLESVDFDRLKGDFLEDYGGTFTQFHIKDKDYLESLITNKIEFKITPHWTSVLEISGFGASPHIDHNTVCLNYYVDPSDCITVFWEERDSATQIEVPCLQEDGSYIATTARAYDITDIRPVKCFKAKADEAFLLDVKKIHSADKILKKGIRKVIRWAWDNYDFNTIKNSINIKCK